ncbi:class I SAM-dependent methyltransferase family protein [Methanohalophilus sp. RSK]|uniref:class I SAM-dependent methyltransferase n=1 Tax=Methanohalophilus sp. RSK TaxID=2485783 RepID=UPI000F43E0D8|nr:class I SAM-dependent methyltransferase family protein [Methanohalophilus sp. RSK]RNI15859.1 class I SAM-dependent methyltransferase family protein [Methanohalophilus sp. RSK]
MSKNSLKTLVEKELPADLIEYVPNRFDVVGDIAIVSIPPELRDYSEMIATKVVSMRGNIRTVLNKISRVKGDHRVSDFENLLGGSTVTTHGEFKYRYRLDLSEVFFNPRLGYERHRVTSLVLPGEDVLVPFCGVGPFAIPAAIRDVRVFCIEKNRHACHWLAENIRLNNFKGHIYPINADAGDIPVILDMKFDRLIVPTPYGQDHFFSLLSPLLKEGGMMHFYTFQVAEDIEKSKQAFQDAGYEIIGLRRCGNVARGVSRWVFDLKKNRLAKR